jgi:hypothetical protein
MSDAPIISREISSAKIGFGRRERGDFRVVGLAGRRAWREAQTVMREIVEQNPDGSGDDDDF